MKNIKNNISFFQWNARSIWTNLPSFENHIVQNRYAVLALQSLNIEKRKMPKLENYFYPPITNCINPTDKVYSALYVRKDLKYSVNSGFSQKFNDINCHIASVKVKLSNEVIINFVSLYLPQGVNHTNTDWLKDPSIKEGSWCILGDFNSHDPMWENNCTRQNCTRLVENITDSSLIILNDGDFTRIPDIQSHRPTAIDLSLVSADLALSSTWYTYPDSLGSDHLPIIIDLNKEDENNFPIDEKIPKFKYHLARWDIFKEHLNSVNVERLYDTNVDTRYSKFRKVIIEAAEKAIPKVKSKKGKKTGNVWWTDDCQQAVDDKKSSFKKWKKNKTEENFKEMKRFKIICNRVVAKAKKSYWSFFCEKEISDSTDSFKVWKKAKQMKNVYVLQSYPVKIDDNTFPTSGDKAEAFNTFFTNNSLSSSLDPDAANYRKSEQSKRDFEDPIADNDHYLNANITYDEFENALNHFSNNCTAVGLDGISFSMLSNLPKSFKQGLFSFFQDCWINETLPKIWKSSVIVPVPKDGKPRSQINSYRPIALTSHVCKLFEEIILIRLSHHCERHKIIPFNQSGFRKGRSTSDHLIRLTNHIKHQFSRRKSVLASFFDVKKAYDSVWHGKLLQKLKQIGLSGHIYQYIKNFLNNRCISTRIENVYSSEKQIDQGIPQGSLIAPLLFSILIYDLPSVLSSSTFVAQYADDIAIWINCSLRKNTNKRATKYFESIFQKEINSIDQYMRENGLQLSGEKTVLMLFNNGKDSPKLPKLSLGNEVLQYKDHVKFLGVYFSRNLSWKMHIEHLITKARKNLNLLKIISSKPWGQDTKTLIHVANALVRSRLTYGQENFCSAPKYLIDRLQSIDSKAFKIALGVPISTNTLKCYSEAGVLPLNVQRQLAGAKFITRFLAIPENTFRNDILFSSKDYPNRAKNIPYLKTLYDYCEKIFEECKLNVSEIQESPITPVLPPWEHSQAIFDIDYDPLYKNEDPFRLISNVRMHLENQYKNYLRIYTDGSVIEGSFCGSGFVIPDLNIKKSFHIGQHFSIFTCELFSIFSALSFINDLNLDLFNILLCVDSKAVLYAIKNQNSKNRRDLLFEIRYLIHTISQRGIGVTFVWVPSHLGLYWNDCADRLAKEGAKENIYSIKRSCYELHIDGNEIKSIMKAYFHNKYKIRPYVRLLCPRYIACLIHKLRLNSWKTKFTKEISCPCSNDNLISIQHLFFECTLMKNQGIDFSNSSISEIILDVDKMKNIAIAISKTPLKNFL